MSETKAVCYTRISSAKNSVGAFDYQARRLTLKNHPAHKLELKPILPLSSILLYHLEQGVEGGPQPWLVVLSRHQEGPPSAEQVLIGAGEDPDKFLPLGRIQVGFFKQTNGTCLMQAQCRPEHFRGLAKYTGDPSGEGFWVFSKLGPSVKPAFFWMKDEHTSLWWVKL